MVSRTEVLRNWQSLVRLGVTVHPHACDGRLSRAVGCHLCNFLKWERDSENPRVFSLLKSDHNPIN